MIGQHALLPQIDKMVAAGFPRFSIICGDKNSGKKTLVKEISKRMGIPVISCGIKVEDIRQTIEVAYKQVSPVIYLFPDADKMSLAAKNSMLKITEEPPQMSFFILTISDINNTLDTIKSRATVLNMDPYKGSELEEYLESKRKNLDPEARGILLDTCTVPGEIDLILKYDIINFYNFVEKVVGNLGRVNGANAFKITQQFSFKEDDPGWDIKLFFKAFNKALRDHMIMIRPSGLPYTTRGLASMILVTNKYLNELNINGIHKPSTVDMWILEMRGVMRNPDHLREER